LAYDGRWLLILDGDSLILLLPSKEPRDLYRSLGTVRVGGVSGSMRWTGQPFKEEAQASLFKDTVRTSQ